MIDSFITREMGERARETEREREQRLKGDREGK